jgi:hypothetical protein
MKDSDLKNCDVVYNFSSTYPLIYKKKLIPEGLTTYELLKYKPEYEMVIDYEAEGLWHE